MNNENITAVGCLSFVVTVVLLIAQFAFVTTNATTYDYQYETAKSMSSNSLSPYDDQETYFCDYPGCENNAVKHLCTTKFYTHIMGKGIKYLQKMPNNANFTLVSEEFTYTKKKDVTHNEKNIYLVPQYNGEIKIEARNDEYVVQVNNGIEIISYVMYEGYYCPEHEQIAYNTWKKEVDDVFTNNFGYFVCKYGIWIVIFFTPICIGVVAIVEKTKKKIRATET